MKDNTETTSEAKRRALTMAAAPNPPRRTAAGTSRNALTPTKLENTIDLATRGEPPLVAGFKS